MGTGGTVGLEKIRLPIAPFLFPTTASILPINNRRHFTGRCRLLRSIAAVLIVTGHALVGLNSARLRVHNPFFASVRVPHWVSMKHPFTYDITQRSPLFGKLK